MKKYLFVLLLWVIAIHMPVMTQNSGWLQPKGSVKILTYYGRYNADAYRDSKGNKYGYADDGKFSGDYFKLNAQAGITDDINVYVALPLVYNSFVNNNGGKHQFGLGDAEIAVLGNLKKWKYRYLIGSAGIGIPLYSKNTDPSIGLGEFSGAASLKYCGSLDKAYKTFFAVESGLRLYFDGTLWWNNTATIGYHINKKHHAIAELNSTKSFDTGAFSQIPTANRSNFIYVKASLGYYYQLTEKMQIGGFISHDIYDRNSSIGKGFSFFATYVF
ncbi:MAG: hypothetical protein RL662_515 [Bacteroidota bacterium]|jgi:hypothetical protein